MTRVRWSVLLVLVAGCTALKPGTDRGDGSLPGADAGDAGRRRDAGERVDSGPFDGGDGGETDPDSGPDGGSDSCPDPTFSCGPTVPSGWNGPIILISGDGSGTPPACPSTAPVNAFTTRSGLDAPPAVCGCACAAPSASDMSCGAVVLTSTSSCTVGGTERAIVAQGACFEISALPTTGWWRAFNSTFSASGTCAPQPSIEVPRLSWAASHRGCGFGTPASCGSEGVCVPPRAAGERLCVHVEGDATCPSEFPDRIATAETVDDGRSCSACSCGSITGSCAGAIRVVSGCSGTTSLLATIPVGGCVEARSLGPSPTQLVSGGFTPSGTCSPSTVGSVGAALPRVLRTVCCVSPEPE